MTLNIAFYAPLKPPDHPIPSGDRQMARMLMAALGKTGHRVFLASRYISYSKRHGAEHLDARKDGAKEEANRLLREWEEKGGAPDLWFCYHPYDKSPDWLGMEICSRLEIPMITAEPCKTGQGPNGEWEPWRAEAQAGIRMAAMNIVMTHSDEAYLKTFIDEQRIRWLNPFIDGDMLEKASDETTLPRWPRQEGVKLLSVGMLRPGAKMDSYSVLVEALGRLKENVNDKPWSSLIIGGGPGEDELRQMLAARLGENWQDHVNLAGEAEPDQVISLMSKSDLLAWPGCREAYGMVYLEAACQGTPSLALDNMGVPLVVADGISGVLVSPPSPENYALALERLVRNPDLLCGLGKSAQKFAGQERSSINAAKFLSGIIDGVMGEKKN